MKHSGLEPLVEVRGHNDADLKASFSLPELWLRADLTGLIGYWRKAELASDCKLVEEIAILTERYATAEDGTRVASKLRPQRRPRPRSSHLPGDSRPNPLMATSKGCFSACARKRLCRLEPGVVFVNI